MSQQQPGSQPSSERTWWWKIAQHLDAAQLALVNAMSHNTDDPAIIIAFHDSVRQAQAILLEIFKAKGLLPQEPPTISAPVPTGEGPPAGEPPPPFAGAPPFAGFSIPWSGPSVPPPPPPPQAQPVEPPTPVEAAAPVEERALADEGNGHTSEPHAVVLEEPLVDVPEAKAEA
jgi:hypothetical protein